MGPGEFPPAAAQVICPAGAGVPVAPSLRRGKHEGQTLLRPQGVIV